MPFPYYRQPDGTGCGPTCIRMVAKHYGRNYKVQTLRKLCEINREGVSLLGMSDAAGKIGFCVRRIPEGTLLHRIREKQGLLRETLLRHEVTNCSFRLSFQVM